MGNRLHFTVHALFGHVSILKVYNPDVRLGIDS
jgi:hypothetical protein